MRLKKLGMLIRKSRWFQRAAGGLYARYIRFVYRTTRWVSYGHEAFDADIAKGVSHVLCCWHNRIALSTFYRDWRDHPFYILASEHEDARILAHEMEGRGIRLIGLKTSGNNRRAMTEAARLAQGGALLGLAPDGPLGPRCEVKPGAIILASKARAYVTPYAFSTSRRIVLRTWDRFVLPLPFSRGVFVMGEGFMPPAALDATGLSACRTRLAHLLDEVAAEADRLADTPPGGE